jgi:ubiquitin carboxyl-terminal hydrolase L3
MLEADEEVEVAHESTAAEGQSEVVQDVNTHFVAFVHKDGHLYELDGRKKTPVNHGPSSKETLLQDATKVIREFMARDPEEVRFALTALAPVA